MFEKKTILTEVLAGCALRSLGENPERLAELSTQQVRELLAARADELFLLGGEQHPQLRVAVLDALELEGTERAAGAAVLALEAPLGVAGSLWWTLSTWRTAAAELLAGYADDVLTREAMESYASAEAQLRALLRG